MEGRYQYKVMEWKMPEFDRASVESELNRQARAGWRLKTVDIHGRYILEMMLP